MLTDQTNGEGDVWLHTNFMFIPNPNIYSVEHQKETKIWNYNQTTKKHNRLETEKYKSTCTWIKSSLHGTAHASSAFQS